MCLGEAVRSRSAGDAAIFIYLFFKYSSTLLEDNRQHAAVRRCFLSRKPGRPRAVWNERQAARGRRTERRGSVTPSHPELSVAATSAEGEAER